MDGGGTGEVSGAASSLSLQGEAGRTLFRMSFCLITCNLPDIQAGGKTSLESRGERDESEKRTSAFFIRATIAAWVRILFRGPCDSPRGSCVVLRGKSHEFLAQKR